MRKLILTATKQAKIAVVFQPWESENEKEQASDIGLFPEDNSSLVGNIYIGHVRDVVKNIEAAFVEIAPDILGYLPLKQDSPVFVCRKNTEKICEGDNLIVQVVKDKGDTKNAVLTTRFSLTGRYVVLTHQKHGIQFSSKIHDDDFKSEMRAKLEYFLQNQETPLTYGIIVRTEGYEADVEEILRELEDLIARYHTMIALAKTRQKHYLLKETSPPLLEFVQKQISCRDPCEIITDNGEIYELLKEYRIPEIYQNCGIRFYQDELLPLYKLYSLERVFSEAYARKIWLKSGAYLVIDYTEAMTVIDVNTGKCEKGKDKETTILAINMEAAREIARQMRIRNLSGIILVDFIDMQNQENTKQLLYYIRELLAKDSVKSNAVDITKLHLMEITRQKKRERIPYIEHLWTS